MQGWMQVQLESLGKRYGYCSGQWCLVVGAATHPVLVASATCMPRPSLLEIRKSVTGDLEVLRHWLKCKRAGLGQGRAAPDVLLPD